MDDDDPDRDFVHIDPKQVMWTSTPYADEESSPSGDEQDEDNEDFGEEDGSETEENIEDEEDESEDDADEQEEPREDAISEVFAITVLSKSKKAASTK